ncbi:acyl-CoA synthetase (AMP-forming)/AMP-acid ligase II [Actinobacteria bacterium IMCC26207]|nr:acyl-CoA synthetase (AMP-forming)/AMP-acid ligase II [Actinobacteria bacterium IMCC26207]
MTIPRSFLGRADLALRRSATLADLMMRLAEMHGEKLFVTEEDETGLSRRITFQQASEQVAAWTRAIRTLSEPGRPVVIATANGIDQFMLCLAVSAAGGLPAPVNPQMSEAEVAHVIADSGASLVIRTPDELPVVEGSTVLATPSPKDVAALFYTSGTTGKPKGAELTHQALVGQVSVAAMWPFTLRHDELVLALPVAHIMGFVALMGPAVAGIPIYFMQRFSPRRTLQIIEHRRCSAFIGVPAMYRTLLEAGAAEADLSSIRVWISGADVMPADLALKFKSFGASATLPGLGPIGEAAFMEGYGMVEVGGNVATKLSPPMLPIGLGDSLGLSMPGWKFKVADRSGRGVLPGQVGELRLKGPGVLKGYWGDAQASSEALTEDGWLRTGDLVRSGPFGMVMFQGRAKAVIKSGGYSVYPVEVEADIEEHPDVLEAAVVGIPDAKLGEVPVAAVRLRPKAKVTPQELVVWAGVRMAQYKAPRRILIVEELPRTGTRKIQRDRLLPLFSE